MLSKHCKDLTDCYNIKVGGVKTLIPNPGDKIEYVVHHENLKYYLSLGMKLVKIHRILSFKQSNWFKSYVHFHTKKRQKTKDPFSQNLYKLLVNCIYGKSIECVHKRVNIKLLNDKKHIKKLLTSQISYHKKYLIKILYLFIVLKKY